jgi:drug/metabolite transporter (DMT)-like permease
LLLFSCNLMWALQFTCIKLVQDQAGPYFTVWAPMTLSMAMLYPLVRRERAAAVVPGSLPAGPRPNLVRTYLLLGLLGVVPGQVVMTWGTRMTLASNAALISLTLPLATALFAVLFLHEKMTWVRWVSFVLAIAGVLMCSGIELKGLDFGARLLAGNLLVFLATLGSAFYNSYGKRALEWHSPIEMLFWTYVVVTVAMAPFVIVEDHADFAQIPQFHARTWLGFALLTFFHNYLSMILFLKALKALDAIQAALSNYLIAFFGVPIAAIMLGERLSAAQIAGGVLVVASTAAITMLDRGPKSAEARP